MSAMMQAPQTAALHENLLNKNGQMDEGDSAKENSVLIQSKFIERISSYPYVGSAMLTASDSYKRVKDYTPSLMKPAVNTAEATSWKVAQQVITVAHALKLPLHAADNIACAGLDKIDSLNKMISRKPISDDPTLTDDEKDFYFMLGPLLTSAKDTALSGLKNNFNMFIECQLRLLDRLEVAIMGLSNGQKQVTRSLEQIRDCDIEKNFSKRLEVWNSSFRQIIDDARQQSHVMGGWMKGVSNPVLPIWTHLQQAAHRLTLGNLEEGIQVLEGKLQVFRHALHVAIENFKMALKEPEATLAQVKACAFENALGFARAWMPQFVVGRLEKLQDFFVLPLEEKFNDASTQTKQAIAKDDEHLKGCVHKSQHKEIMERKDRPANKKHVSIVEPMQEYVEASITSTLHELHLQDTGISPAKHDIALEENGQRKSLEESTEIDPADLFQGTTKKSGSRRRKNHHKHDQSAH